MKKILTLGFVLFLSYSTWSASTMNVINASTNYTLYFNTIAMGHCYPQFREYYPTSPTGSGYCDLLAGGSVSFDNYSDLQGYYPNLDMTMKVSSGGGSVPISVAAVDQQMSIPALNIDWAIILYKMQSSNNVEGTWLGASDYYNCHGLPDFWGTFGTTDTYSYFTIGGTTRYFVAGEY